MAEDYFAFLSYAQRHRRWVEAFHRDIEACLAHVDRETRVFLDLKDVASGGSWVAGLEDGLADAQQLILVLTPEALASEWVTKEWQSFLARGPSRKIHVIHLVDTPAGSLPPFLADLQWLDFRGYDAAGYRESLSRLMTYLLGDDPRARFELPSDLTVPPAPPTLPVGVGERLGSCLQSVLAARIERRAVEAIFGLDPKVLEGPGDAAGAAVLALALVIADDDPVAAAKRMISTLAAEVVADRPNLAASLDVLRQEVDELARNRPQSGLLRAWLARVVADHERLVPYFQQRAELDLLERVYVQLELRTESRIHDEKLEEEVSRRKPHSDRPTTLRKLLQLDPEEESWVTHRWVVLGDPGAGKTTLLRHLAATIAAEDGPSWVPVFESLPRLMRESQWLLDRIAGHMRRAGHPAEGLASALDREGEEGRLLLLLDGLDEVPREARDEAEALLLDLARRWPRTPIVVSSRPIGYRRPRRDFVELELLPFDGKRRQEFLCRWFGRVEGEPDEDRGRLAAAKLEGDSVLRELAGNPLYLTLMALLIEQGTAPERNRPALYDQVFELLLRGRHREPPTPMERPTAVRRMLRHLGYGMTDDNLDAEAQSDLEDRLYRPEADLLRHELERVGRWRPRVGIFLEDLAERTGILGPHDGPEADWRFWHRTFREALAAETLAEILAADGEEAVLDQARDISGDLSRWAEPYALLAGQASNPDALVEALVEANHSLGLRALATAQGLRPETFDKILELSGDHEARAAVYRRLPELVGDPQRSLALLDRLRRRTTDGEDLFHLEAAVTAVGDQWSGATRDAARLRARLFDHCPAPSEDLFRWIQTKERQVELWREIPAGSFLMGSPDLEKGRYADEGPQHRVTITSSFVMTATPITNAQFAAFDPNFQPYRWDGVSEDDLSYHPAVRISWYQAMSFCRWLAGSFEWARGARLPTEEEWEYSCRAGTETAYWSGDEESDLKHAGWYGEGSQGRTHKVAGKPANPWGLYDVHGNVWEWTLSPGSVDYSHQKDDREHDPSAITAAEHVAADSGAKRVIRGGSFWSDAQNVRSAFRSHWTPGVRDRDRGFRVLLPAAPRF